MDERNFLYLCVKKGIAILPYDNNPSLRNYKRLTKHFEYPCNFKENGGCVSHINSMCCCNNCAPSVGHLRNIRTSNFPITITKYSSRYNTKTGFWRPKKGCILPRGLRSITCVAYICYDIEKAFKIKNGENVVNFMGLLYDYNKLSPRNKERLHNLYIKIKQSKE